MPRQLYIGGNTENKRKEKHSRTHSNTLLLMASSRREFEIPEKYRLALPETIIKLLLNPEMFDDVERRQLVKRLSKTRM